MAKYPIDSDFILRESSASPKGRFGRYCKIAILEVDAGCTSVREISTRATGVRSIVEVTDRLHFGSTARSEAGRERARLEAECRRLNKSQQARRKRAATVAAKQELAVPLFEDAISLAT